MQISSIVLNMSGNGERQSGFQDVLWSSRGCGCHTFPLFLGMFGVCVFYSEESHLSWVILVQVVYLISRWM